MCTSMGGTQSLGAVGTGVKYTVNGKERNLYVTSTGRLIDITTAERINKSLSAEETVKRIVESGKGTFLSKSEVDKLIKKRLKERAETPDYELGNPFNERGRAKRVYRPKRVYEPKK